MAWRATSRHEEPLAEALPAVTGPRRCAPARRALCANHGDKREVAMSAVASSGLRPSRACSCRLRLSIEPFRFVWGLSLLP
jgi:hypothetical protein